MTVSIQEAAEKRAAAAEAGTGVMAQRGVSIPDGVTKRRSAPMACQMRAGEATKDGKSYLKLTGYASTYEQGYQMWDWSGPYTEIVSKGAGAASLAANPDVVYLLNHSGIPFARTISGTLDLSEDDTGLLTVAYLNPKRQDAKDLVAAVDEKSITEMSFAFSIPRGQWSPDYMEYRIQEYDIDRGDTSPVNFGANPNTSIEARAAQFELRAELMRFLSSTEGPALAAAREVLVEQATVTVGSKAAEELRHLRACVEQGSLGAGERANLAAVLQRATEGTLGQALAGDAGLGVLLGVTAPVATPVPVAAPFVAESVDFVGQLMNAARELPPVTQVA